MAAAPPNGDAPTGSDANSNSVSPAAAPAATAPPPAPSQPPQSTKLTNAELKAKKQAEKAARRGKVIAAKDPTASQGAQPPPPSSHGGGGDRSSSQASGLKSDGASSAANTANKSAKPKDGGMGSSQTQSQSRPGHQRRTSAGRNSQAQPKVEHQVKKELNSIAIPSMFSHLPLHRIPSLSEASKDVHPAVLALGQQMAHFVLSDNAARCKAMLLAFKKVIKEYESPQGHVFSRHFVPQCLSDQIEWLTACRPMCFAMGNAIRKLKYWVSVLDLHISDEAAKTELCDRIDLFIQEKIDLADVIVSRNAADLITSTSTADREDDASEPDLLLTYGNPRLVRKALQRAWADGKTFQVAIVDDGPWHTEGKSLAKILRRDGIRVYYYPTLAGLGVHVKTATRVLLGAEAFFQNGAMYAPIGTFDVVVAAHDRGVPVLALCETVHIDAERVAVDSLTYNERLPAAGDEDSADAEDGGGDDDDGEVVEQLMFDTTPEKYLTMVITEYETVNGNSPPSAIGSILRRQEAPDEAA